MIESVRRNHEATAYERYNHLGTVRRQPVTPIRTGEDRNQSDAHEKHDTESTVTAVSFDEGENTEHGDQ
jgi:hypothetical protein